MAECNKFPSFVSCLALRFSHVEKLSIPLHGVWVEESRWNIRFGNAGTGRIDLFPAFLYFGFVNSFIGCIDDHCSYAVKLPNFCNAMHT